MIQTLLFFGLGFLTASFIALLIAPAIRRRAIRLTRRDVEARMPMTREEIQSRQDAIRAEAALEIRRLEMEAASLRETIREQKVELDRRHQGMLAEQETRAQREGTIAERDGHVARLEETIAADEAEIERLGEEIARQASDIERRREELDRMATLYEEASLTSSSRQIELVARETEIDRLTGDLASLRRQRNEADRKLRELTSDTIALREAVKNETRRSDDQARRIEKLMADLSDREERLERRETELARLKGTATNEAPAVLEEAPLDERIVAERDRLEAALSAYGAKNGRARKGGRKAASLREEIQDIAAEMVHLTARREGEVSPIADALANAAHDDDAWGTPSLARRIAALGEAGPVSDAAGTAGAAPQPMQGDR